MSSVVPDASVAAPSRSGPAPSNGLGRVMLRGTVRVLDHVDGWSAALTRADARQATARCLAPKIVVPRGRWAPPRDGLICRDWMGLLVLDGLVSRTVEVHGLRTQELLGAGDLVRTWEDGNATGTIPTDTTWTVLDEATVAILHGGFATTAAQWPSVSSALVAAAVRRCQAHAVVLAASTARRADTRLMLLFWHLADRWGTVSGDGVVVPIRLTHEQVAQLVCLRRPTVSQALSRLRARGWLSRRADGAWLLARESRSAVVA